MLYGCDGAGGVSWVYGQDVGSLQELGVYQEFGEGVGLFLCSGELVKAFIISCFNTVLLVALISEK